MWFVWIWEQTAITPICALKVKVKFSLEQATKAQGGVEV